MTWFTKNFISFLKDLEKNNNAEWFKANKERFEETVKEPFIAFIDELIARIRKQDTAVTMNAKEAVFRINRDVRFSADKTPYKTHMSALISEGPKKDKSRPGVYIEFSSKELRFYSGLYELDTPTLQKVRTAIARERKAFAKLLNASAFKNSFGAILGEKNKRVPKEFESIVAEQPLIANKQFYFYGALPASSITDPKLPELFMKYYKDSTPMREFLTNALKG